MYNDANAKCVWLSNPAIRSIPPAMRNDLMNRTNMNPNLSRRPSHGNLLLPPPHLALPPSIRILLPHLPPQNLPSPPLAREKFDGRFDVFGNGELGIYSSASFRSDVRLNNGKVGEGEMNRSDEGNQPSFGGFRNGDDDFFDFGEMLRPEGEVL